MLAAEGLHKRYGPVVALDGFDLSVAAGEVVGLIGRNGAGKSTFMAIAAGILRPDRGTVRIDGIVGLAGQEIALYPTATVRENVRFFGRVQGLRGQSLRAAVDEVVLALRLTGSLGTRVAMLSGGQRRRVHAAVALLHRPSVLLLDEPTVGADPASREALLAAVRARADAGAAVCYTTHYLPELDLLDATVALAEAGRVVLRGGRADLPATLDELFREWTADAA